MSAKVIGNKYRVLRDLGEGSYGKVILVEHIDLGVRYALKLLKQHLSDDAQFLDRFKLEAEILLRFSHPGSVQLRDFGRTEDGLYYMATDYCEGILLEQVLDGRNRIEIVQSLQIAIAILSTLEAAHALGIIHRDIKSANIMLEGLKSAEGKAIDLRQRHAVKVLDFGIAKLTEELRQDSSSTLKGVSIGTPAYMPPEQAAGETELDARADLYSTGILLYELLTGDVPFFGRSVVQVLLKHLTQTPPPFPPQLGIPGYIEGLVMKALEKEREERYQSAAEFKRACEGALEQYRSETAVEPPLKSLARPPRPTQEGALAPSDSSNLRILCLDDNEMILGITRHMFEKEGFTVFSASNFTAIHDIIFRERVRVMLCDVNMPGLPGNKICQMLKKTVPELTIILFSNIPERDLEKLSIECGADGWISKNAKPDQWVKGVREHLDKIHQSGGKS